MVVVLPFKQKKIKGLLVREFSENTKPADLTWHRDRSDRKVKVCAGKGWRLQLENKLPVSLMAGKSYFIPKNAYHRILKGERNLVIEIKENNKMKVSKRQLRRIIREAEGSTKKYDDDSALKGDQSKLPDGLQKSIIDKTVDDREEQEEEDKKEKNESLRITKRQLKRIIREYKEMLSPAHIDGQPWSGTLEDLASVQSKTWGHGEVVDSKGYKEIVNHARDLTAGKAKSPVKKYGK